MTSTLVRIEAPYFVAGAVLVEGRVTEAAPILHYVRGWTLARLTVYARSKGWTVGSTLPQQTKQGTPGVDSGEE